MPLTTPERIKVMEAPITVFDSYEHASSVIIQSVLERNRVSCVAINPEKVYTAWKDKQLSDMIDSAEFCICDGIGMAIAVRLLHGYAIHRVTGIQLFFDLVAHAEANGLRIFLLGATPESNQKACEKLHKQHPKLKIVGRSHGYFRDNKAVIAQINNSHADMLFVAMGSPRQEKWLTENRDHIAAHFCMGVGGSFDVLGGTVKWAPRVFQKTGTEWLYRLVLRPRRLRRQIVLLPFALTLLWRLLVLKATQLSQGNLTRPVKAQRAAQIDRLLSNVTDDAARADTALSQKT